MRHQSLPRQPPENLNPDLHPLTASRLTRAHWTPTLTDVARTYNKWAQLIEGLFGGPHVKASVERVAVFVDVGYLFAQGSIELSGGKLSRKALELDYGAVVAALRRFAESASKLPLLRIYWYDGTNQGPTAVQIAMARLDNVKVRLGFVNASGQQKGVDSLIVTDMIALARNGAMAECVLLSGDEDLRVGVQQAQEYGVRVHLLGVKPARGSQSMFLYQEADTTHEWNRSDISEFMGIKRTENHDVDSQSGSKGSDRGLRVLTDQLRFVAKSIADGIPESELRSLAACVKREGMHPKELDGQLLALGRQVLGRFLSKSEKRRIRDEFRKALASRSR